MKSLETIEKMRAAARARCTSEWRMKQSDSKKQKVDEPSIVTRYYAGETQQELAVAFSTSRKVIQNVLKRNNVICRRAAKRNQWGANNSTWRGSEASLVCKHKRLYRKFGQPKKCDVCGTEDESRTYDWANLTGNYDDPKDFKRMCRSCHWKHDKKHLNFG